MKKKGKQLLSLLLSAVMVLSLLPPLTLTAMAAAPIVSSVTPSGTDADISGSIVITFSEAVDTNTTGTVSLDVGNTSLTGGNLSNDAMSYSVPYSELNSATTYTVTISGFSDTSGNTMTVDSSHSFTTSPSAASAGSGTVDDPYIINSLADLGNVTNNPSAYYKLNTDIKADTPLASALCSQSSPFTGNFDGNGKSIAVNITDTVNNYVGLFAYIGKGGSVKNLTVTGSVTGSAVTLYLGALTGENEGQIDSCVSNATVTANGSTLNNVGGLIGWNTGTITNSRTGGSVTAGGKAVAGGLVGINYSTTTSGGAMTSAAMIQNCNASADVTADTNGSDAGGLVGNNKTSSTMQPPIASRIARLPARYPRQEAP